MIVQAVLSSLGFRLLQSLLYQTDVHLNHFHDVTLAAFRRIEEMSTDQRLLRLSQGKEIEEDRACAFRALHADEVLMIPTY